MSETEAIDFSQDTEGQDLVTALAENGVSEPEVYQRAFQVDRERELARIEAEIQAQENRSAIQTVLQEVDPEKLANAAVTLVEAGARLSQDRGLLGNQTRETERESVPDFQIDENLTSPAQERAEDLDQNQA